MDKITRTIEVQDEREAGKSLEDDAQGVLDCLDAMPDATIEDIGTNKLELRQSDDRDAMIAAVRADAAEVYEEPIEIQETGPSLTALKEQYEALSEKDRTCSGEIHSWEEVYASIPNLDHILTEIGTLSDPKVCFLNEQGQLVLVDGCAEPPEKTLGWNYHKSRTEATRISYVDSEGQVVVIDDDDTEIPSEAQVISQRGLIFLEEYERVNKGQFEEDKDSWIESGKNPSIAGFAGWWGFCVDWDDAYVPDLGIATRGSRRALRVNLSFES